MAKFIRSDEVATQSAQRIRALGSVPAADVLMVQGREFHAPEVAAVYQHALDTRDALARAEAVVKVARAARDAAEEARRLMDVGLRGWVINRFGPQSEQALAFGFVTKVRRTPKVETTVRAIELSRATRRARNTLGRRQRLRIKGELPLASTASTEVAVTPVPTPEDPTKR